MAPQHLTVGTTGGPNRCLYGHAPIHRVERGQSKSHHRLPGKTQNPPGHRGCAVCVPGGSPPSRTPRVAGGWGWEIRAVLVEHRLPNSLVRPATGGTDGQIRPATGVPCSAPQARRQGIRGVEREGLYLTPSRPAEQAPRCLIRGACRGTPGTRTGSRHRPISRGVQTWSSPLNRIRWSHSEDPNTRAWPTLHFVDLIILTRFPYHLTWGFSVCTRVPLYPCSVLPVLG